MGIFNVVGSLQNIESAEAAGRPLPHLSIPYGEWDWLCGGGALRQRFSHDHLYRASWLEAARCPVRLFGFEWFVYQLFFVLLGPFNPYWD